MVDVRGVVVLDELVKPWAPVADYLTKHSGVTQALLENVHTRIEQVSGWCLSFQYRVWW